MPEAIESALWLDESGQILIVRMGLADCANLAGPDAQGRSLVPERLAA